MRQATATIAALFFVTALAQAQSPPAKTKEQLEQVQQQRDLLQSFQEKVQAYYQQLQQGGGGRGARGIITKTPQGSVFVWKGGAWWTNANLVARLGLTDNQKSKIEKAFENHRQNLSHESTQLDKQETQLAVLLAADPVDHNAVLSQIDRVAQARADLERANSAMTLEMREVLTANGSSCSPGPSGWTAQWPTPAIVTTGNTGIPNSNPELRFRKSELRIRIRNSR
jgi:hypothetical protein